jgi:predicted ester cyclase
MPTPEEYEQRLETLYEGVWNGADPAVADDIVAPGYLIHDRDLAAQLRGPDLYRALADGTREVFPDMHLTVEDVFGAGDRVAARWTMTGTHEGSLFGEEPTGREVQLPAVEINRFEDGLLAETWTQSDMFGLKQQVTEE